MDSLIVEGVRCFAGRQVIPLRPLTLLVGENSTGKSTLLALSRIAWQLASSPGTPDFNEAPFSLGAFEQVAHRNGSSSRRHFSIGLEIELPAVEPDGFYESAAAPVRALVEGLFSERDAQPHLEERLWDVPPIRVRASGTGRAGALVVEGPELAAPTKLPVSFADALPVHLLRTSMKVAALTLDQASEADDATIAALEEYCHMMRRLLAGLSSKPRALAPVRSRPRRTYDPVQEMPDPEGQHVPMILARLASTSGSDSALLREKLAELGSASGLFDTVDVNRRGRKKGDPFQVEVRIADRSFNLMDVGYGVSQVLPIVVDSLLAPERSLFLLQQPEVHLHPRAQAALGSFVASLVTTQHKRFLLETHSDHLVDRVRMEVRDQRGLSAEHVVILYFERQGPDVTVHPIFVDEDGELLDVPSSYRSFFLTEQRRFLVGT